MIWNGSFQTDDRVREQAGKWARPTSYPGWLPRACRLWWRAGEHTARQSWDEWESREITLAGTHRADPREEKLQGRELGSPEGLEMSAAATHTKPHIQIWRKGSAKNIPNATSQTGKTQIHRKISLVGQFSSRGINKKQKRAGEMAHS